MEDTIMDTKILEQLEEAFVEEFELVQHDLGTMEELIKQKMQLLGKGLLQRMVNRYSNGYKKSSIACKCGGSMKFIQHRPKYVHTLFGWIKIRRAYYRCPDCGETLFPYDLASGLGSEQISPALAKTCCMIAVDDSFEQTSRKIEALTGQKVSDNTIERLVYQVGSTALKQQDQSLKEFFERRQIPADSGTAPLVLAKRFAVARPDKDSEKLYIAVDGTTAHEIDGWHEVKHTNALWIDIPAGCDRRRRKRLVA